MLTRNKNGKLRLKDLVVTVIAEDLFEECEDCMEVEWLLIQLVGGITKAAQERNDELDYSQDEILETSKSRGLNTELKIKL